MNKINDGGPAFPMQEPQAIHAHAIAAIDGITDTDERDRLYTAARAAAVGGMSLRDYFAAKAMQAQLTAFWAMETHHGWTHDEIAREAYAMANAMLAARGAQ